MRILNSIVEPSFDFPKEFDTEIIHSCWVRSKAISHNFNRASVALQRLLEEPQSRGFITFLGDVALQNLALVIDSAPQLMRLSIDLHEDFVDGPTPVCVAFHAANALPFDIGCKQRAEPVPP